MLRVSGLDDLVWKFENRLSFCKVKLDVSLPQFVSDAVFSSLQQTKDHIRVAHIYYQSPNKNDVLSLFNHTLSTLTLENVKYSKYKVKAKEIILDHSFSEMVQWCEKCIVKGTFEHVVDLSKAWIEELYLAQGPYTAKIPHMLKKLEVAQQIIVIGQIPENSFQECDDPGYSSEDN
jgi:hypothetical protein